ncbi:right-handed parallel beta-helix repeat-containing protein [Halorubrum sp. Ea8]|uniref:right-handed parallel beta-helix repeat-containing protein n=1 Tax=Halorubrum sp. Ea8 TaxID=1383841 RepID=UPI000B97E69F|nr:right-handed parallel beta-helix repeat-containing protein [Halorubrum sp. Ea8]OYR49187.1 hypothetical protein DJ74_09135 [Halorubrum sp. Ea8]
MTRARFRAVFLAAIMVLSVVAMGAGFAGSAVAEDGGTTYEVGQGDGTDFETIQQALDSDSLSSGDTLELVDETYSPSGQLSVTTDNVSIVGVGDTTIESGSTGYGIHVTAADVRLTGFEITGAGTYAIKVSGVSTDNGRLDGFTAENVDVRDSGSTGIDLNAVTNATIDSVTVTDTVSGNGVAFTDVTDTEVTDVTTSNNTWGGVAIYADGALSDQLGDDVGSYGIEFTGELGADEPLPLYEQAPADDLITDIDHPTNIQYRVAADLPDGVSASEFDWYYTTESAALDAAAATNNGTETDAAYVSELGGPFVVGENMSIQTAVDVAEAGDTVTVQSGTYTEQVVLNKSLSLVGDNATITAPAERTQYRIAESDEGWEPVVFAYGGSEQDGNVSADEIVDVEIQGFVVDGADFDPQDRSVGILLRNAEGDVVDNTIEGLDASAETFGISVHGDSEIDIVDNHVSEFERGGIGVLGNANDFEDPVPNVSVRDNTVVDPGTTGWAPNGIQFGYGGTGEVVDNTVSGINYSEGETAPGGVVIVSTSDVEVRENNLTDNDDGIQVIGGGFFDDPVTTANITIRDNTISENSVTGLRVAYEPISDLVVEHNNFEANSVHTADSVGVLNTSAVLEANSFDRAAVVGGTIFSDLTSAVDSAEPGDAVVLGSGTYDADVRVETPNVTLVGQGDDTVINGSVALNADETALSQVRVNASVGDVFPNPAASNNAVNVGGSNVTVSDVTVDLSVESVNFSEGLAIEVYGDDASATITNATVSGTGEMIDDGLTAVVGVSVDKGATATVRDSDIDVASDGYSFAVVAREGATTDVRNNELSASGGELNGVGFGVEGDNPEAQTVRFNTFDGVETIENKAGSGTLDVTGNYWTDLADVEFINANGGEIVYDPFLTVEPSELNATSLGETKEFGHDLVIPADGDTHSVAFPAAAEGTVGEVFGEFEGTVYAYNGTGWQSGDAIENESIGALDAFAATIDEGAGDQRITFEYADSGSAIPSMTSTDLEAGWNFVGAPSGDASADDAFASSTTDVTSVVDLVAGPDAEMTPYGLDASGEISNPSRVSPFKGYWVFATDDGELGAAVPVEPTQEDEEDTLTGN